MKRLFAVFWSLLSFPGIVTPAANLQISFIKYENPSHQEYNNLCCFKDTSTCRHPCENIFRTCVSNTSESRECDYGRFESVEIDDDSFVFSTDRVFKGFQNPLVLSIAKWKGEYTLGVQVYNTRDGNNNLVADFRKTFVMKIGEKVEFQLAYGRRSTLKTLKVETRVWCDAGFYPPDCKKECHPTDDHTGHFTCDGVGDKICMPEWKDVTKNCTTRNLTASTALPAMVQPTTTLSFRKTMEESFKRVDSSTMGYKPFTAKTSFTKQPQSTFSHSLRSSHSFVDASKLSVFNKSSSMSHYSSVKSKWTNFITSDVNYHPFQSSAQSYAPSSSFITTTSYLCGERRKNAQLIYILIGSLSFIIILVLVICLLYQQRRYSKQLNDCHFHIAQLSNGGPSTDFHAQQELKPLSMY